MEVYRISATLQELLTQHDFYMIDSKVEEVGRALGLADIGLDRDVTELSGGQRTKVLLGKLLLEKPDILLLDEPTNYLDAEHIVWLKRYLNEYENAFVLISHDIPFLNSVVNLILHLGIDHIKIVLGEQLLEGAEFFHTGFQFLGGGLRHPVAQFVHLRLHLIEKIKGGGQDLPYGHTCLQRRVLVQIAHPDIFGPFDPALIRHKFPRDNIHKSGFSLAVGTHQTDMLSLQQPEGHILKDGPVSETVGQMFYI